MCQESRSAVRCPFLPIRIPYRLILDRRKLSRKSIRDCLLDREESKAVLELGTEGVDVVVKYGRVLRELDTGFTGDHALVVELDDDTLLEATLSFRDSYSADDGYVCLHDQLNGHVVRVIVDDEL